MPNDDSIIGDIQTNIPDIASIASQCSMLLPLESSRLFSQGGMSILHINARSLHQNFDDISSLVLKQNHNADFILISETWLHSNLVSNYQIEGYELVHSIPEDAITGKGCAIYVLHKIYPFCKHLDELCVNSIEFQSIFLHVSLPGKPSFIVATVYRSPSYPFPPFLEYVENTLLHISRLNKPCYWGGDWNIDLFGYNVDNQPKYFLDCLNSYGFYPTIYVPTRISSVPPFTETLIDNIFTNVPETIIDSGSISSGIADHQAVFCFSNLIDNCHRLGRRIRPISRFNYDKIEQLKTNLAIKLDGFFEFDDPDAAADLLMSTISSEVDKLSVSSPTRRSSPIQPWITPALLGSISTRNRLLKVFLKNRSPENQNKYRKYRNVLRLALRNAKKMYYRSQFQKNASKPKQLWADLMEAIQNNKKSVNLPDTFTIGGTEIDDPQDIANQFNNFYSQVAPRLDSTLGPCDVDPMSYMEGIRIAETMTFNPVTQNYVHIIINSLKDTCAGPDRIGTKLLKAISPTILGHITYLINLCLRNNTFPKSFKTAFITPIFKSGSRKEFANYRPISVLPIFSKILETVMQKQLMSFISVNNILYDNQFGFRPKHSTYMPISLLHNFITTRLACDYVTASVYLDLSRAFDTVNTEILLKKLNKYGIRENALELMKSYLTERKQHLKYKDTVSGPENVTCGVPQGSVLGPILFLLYINDISLVCDQAKFLLFADDTAVLYSGPSVADLQATISCSFPKVTKWLHANRLSLSTSKTYFQLYPTHIQTDEIKICVNQTCIKRAKTIKYLGVLVDEDFKFKSHVSKVTSTISRNIGIIARARYLLDSKYTHLLYNALVLPYLSYCIVVWGSNYESTLQPIILAQKRAVRLIVGTGRFSHTSPLFRDLKVLKFLDILHCQFLLILHDFLFGHLPPTVAEMFTLHNQARPTRTIQHFSELVYSPTGEILPNYHHYNYLLFNLFHQAPRVWNRRVACRIPQLQDIPPSKAFFKKCIKMLFFEAY